MPLNQGHVYRQRVAAADAGTSLLAYHVVRFPHSDAETWRGSIEAGRVLVVDKPAGLQVLPAGPFHAHTLLQLVRASARERATSAPVHRSCAWVSYALHLRAVGEKRSGLAAGERSSHALPMLRERPPPALPSAARVAVSFLLLAACAAPGRELPYANATRLPRIEGRVASNLDLLASGRELVDEYVEQLEESEATRLRATIERGRRAAVRLEARSGFGAFGGSYEVNLGSGVIVAGAQGTAQMLTAGHTFTDAAPDLQVRVRSLAGRAIATTLLASENGKRDFALFRCEGLEAREVEPASCIAPQLGELVVALGYPDQCGVNAEGSIVRGEAYADERLEPLVLVLEVSSVAPLRMVPVAGALPLGGFSGGGVFDLDGRVVGVLTGMEWEPGKRSVVVHVTGFSVAELPEH